MTLMSEHDTKATTPSAPGDEATQSAPRKTWPIGLSVAALLVFVLAIGFGFWQLQRHDWKLRVLERVAALKTAPAIGLALALERAQANEDLDLVRVKVNCDGLNRAKSLELYFVNEGGTPGVRLISACPLEGTAWGSILVDRGFIAEGTPSRPRTDLPPLPVEVVGVLRKPEKSSVFSPINDPKGGHWYTRDLAAMAKALGAERPAPYSLVAETSSNPELLALVPIPLPKDIPNRHLEYALTWFALALIDLIFYGALVRRHFQKP